MAMTPENAVAALADLIDHLRERCVRHFEGHLLDAEGKPVWNLVIDFERERARNSKDSDDG